jgi:hypothetical protein
VVGGGDGGVHACLNQGEAVWGRVSPRVGGSGLLIGQGGSKEQGDLVRAAPRGEWTRGGGSMVEMVGAWPAAAPECSGDGSGGGVARPMGTGEEIEKRGRLTNGTTTQCRRRLKPIQVDSNEVDFKLNSFKLWLIKIGPSCAQKF